MEGTSYITEILRKTLDRRNDTLTRLVKSNIIGHSPNKLGKVWGKGSIPMQ